MIAFCAFSHEGKFCVDQGNCYVHSIPKGSVYVPVNIQNFKNGKMVGYKAGLHAGHICGITVGDRKESVVMPQIDWALVIPDKEKEEAQKKKNFGRNKCIVKVCELYFLIRNFDKGQSFSCFSQFV